MILVKGSQEVGILLVGIYSNFNFNPNTNINNIKCFYEVLDTLLILYLSFVTLPTIDTLLSSRIIDNLKYTPYFNDCLRALDGTHIAVYVSVSQQARYRNRKGILSQNVLAVCDFNIRFVYILPEWEGSAHDGRVLSIA
jgi:hypothetical protein